MRAAPSPQLVRDGGRRRRSTELAETRDQELRERARAAWSRATRTRSSATLTFLLYRVPAGTSGWIEDVIVDELQARGRGVGEALTFDAMRRAERGGRGAREPHVAAVPRGGEPALQAARLRSASETNVYVCRGPVSVPP